jgi:methanogenic corrinoid protein MtbC1
MAGLSRRAISREVWESGGKVQLERDAVAKLRPVEQCEGMDRSLSKLVRTIEGEIIPRLMLAHRSGPVEAPAVTVGASAATGDDVAALAKLVLKQDVSEALGYIESVRMRGVPLDTLYLELLAPTARYLGELWEADLCDFTEVTFGLWRLQQMVRELSPAFRHEAEHREQDRRALLLPAPGEQHSFGLFMVAEFLRRAGWDVWAGPAVSMDELVSIVRSEPFAVVGLSVSCETRLDGLASAIHALRRASRNRGVGVMVGGQVFKERPELVALVGADATAMDGRQACLQAEGLLRLLPRVG